MSSGNHPPGTGPRSACAPAAREANPTPPETAARPAASVASLYLQARIFNYLDWVGRSATLLQIHHHLAAVTSREALEAAIADLEARGLLVRFESPSPANPLLDPPIVRWRAFVNLDPFPEGAREFLAQCAAVLAKLEWGADQ